MKKLIVNEITAPFFAACGLVKGKTKKRLPGLIVYFFGDKDGAPFSGEMLDELRGDPSVECIARADTGEVIYIR